MSKYYHGDGRINTTIGGQSGRTRRFVGLLFGAALLYSIVSIASFSKKAHKDQRDESLDAVSPNDSLTVNRRQLSALEDAAESTSADAFPLETPLDFSDSLSSCIMVMDDNHLLVEWIAYHYFVMNMRYLVVLPDPKSRFSPRPVLDRWRDKMTIVEWTYEDYMEEDHLKEAMAFLNNTSSTPEDAQVYHNKRQNEFLRQCAIHMKEHDRKWVSFHDVDEYYVINSNLVLDAAVRMQDPGGGMKLLLEVQGILEPMYDMADIVVTKHYLGPCVTTYRSMYGAVQSTEEEIKQDVPAFLDPRRFETLRWRHHKSHRDPQDGKALLDVTRIEFATLKRKDKDTFTRPHALIPSCPGIFYHSKAFLRINHYIGNWEYYSFRKNDGRAGARKNRSRWSRESSLKGGQTGDEARPWIAGFVRYMGDEETSRLLENCGLNPDFEAPIEEEWLRPEDMPKNPTALDRMKQKNLKKQARAVCDGWSECAQANQTKQ